MKSKLVGPNYNYPTRRRILYVDDAWVRIVSYSVESMWTRLGGHYMTFLFSIEIIFGISYCIRLHCLIFFWNTSMTFKGHYEPHKHFES